MEDVGEFKFTYESSNNIKSLIYHPAKYITDWPSRGGLENVKDVPKCGYADEFCKCRYFILRALF